jgi:TolA-binding protein
LTVSTPSITCRRAILPVVVAAALVFLPGCMHGAMIHIPDKWDFWKKDDATAAKTQAEDAFVMRDGQLVAETTGPVLGGDLEGARLLFREKDYDKAEPIFERIADNTKNTFRILEEARWYEAECYYRQSRYRDAAPVYIQLLNNFPSSKYGEDARQRIFDIANYWLDETRDQMEAAREKREGKRWVVMPLQMVHFEDSKPYLDIEGHALRLLEQVYMTNPRSPLAEKALFMLGSVRFYREDWRDADHYFYQLVLNCPNGKYAAKAAQLSILCKEIDQGGYAYDGRKLQEARELIKKAKIAYPELAQDGDPFLTKQLMQIHAVEAEKDYEVARYWDRTGHPGAAYFSYEIVCRRYPGTSFAEKSKQRMTELKERVDREKQNTANEAPAPANEPAPPPRVLQPDQSPGGPPGTEVGPPPRTLPPGLPDR